MAKKVFRIKDKQGVEVDYCIPSSRVMLGGNKELDQELDDINDDIEELDGKSVKKVTFNGGEPVLPDNNGNVSIDQEKADWEETNPNSPKFIGHKPNVVSDVFYEIGTRTFKKNRNGEVSEIMTLPETGMNSEVQAAINDLQTAINNLQTALNTLTQNSDSQNIINTFNEIVAYLDGIKTNDPNLASTIAGLQQSITTLQGALSGKLATSDIADNLTTNDATKVLSAKQGKELKDYIDQEIESVEAGESIVTSVDNVAIVDNMEGADADTILAAGSARALKEIYVNLKALYTNLAGIAFVGNKPTWQSVDKRKYDLTTSLTACSASVITGDAGSGKVYEGRVVVRLIPTTDYQFSNIALTKNGAAVTFERTNNQDGSVDIAFTATGDITLTATAVDGFLIELVDSPNVGITQSHSGSTYTAVLDPHAHYSLPSTIEVKKGTTTLESGTDYTYTQGTGVVVITGVDGNITIKAIATEDAHATISLASGVSNVVGKHNNNAVTFPLKVYADMLSSGEYAIVFSAADGCKFTTNPNVGGTDLTDNTLTITSTNVSNEASIEVSAAARQLYTFNVNVSVDGHITKDNGTDNGQIPSTIQEDSALTIRLTPDTDYHITIGTKTMGTDTLSDPTNSNGVLTFSIAAVTGEIVIAATATEVGKVNVTKTTRNVSISDNTSNDKINEGSDYIGTISFGPKQITATWNGNSQTLNLYDTNVGGDWSTPTIVVTMGGNELDTDNTKSSYYSFANNVLTVHNVTAALDISAITESKVFLSAYPVHGADNQDTIDSYTTRDIGTNAIWSKVPSTCRKVRLYHAAHTTDSFYDSKQAFMLSGEHYGSASVRDYFAKTGFFLGGLGGSKFPYNYVDLDYSPLSVSITDCLCFRGLFANEKVNECFVVDITDVDATELAAADAAAVAAYNSANGTNITTENQQVSASLDTIVALGGNVIFDGRYAETETLPTT